MLLAGLAAAVAGTDPQCPPDAAACYHQIDVGFGDAFAALSRSQQPLTPEQTDAACDMSHWTGRDRCHAQSPLRFVLLAPDAYAGVSFELHRNAFTPYAPAAHLHLAHVLNGRRTRVVPVGPRGSPARYGCVDEAYADKSYEGAVVVVMRGGCRFHEKFAAAQRAGAVAGILVNAVVSEDDREQALVMKEDSGVALHLPAMAVSRQDGFALLNVLDNNEGDATGQLEFSCPGGDVVSYYPNRPSRCPHPRLRSVCATQESSARRLCQRCAVAMKAVGIERSICLWDNDLKALTKAIDPTSLVTARPLPYTLPAESVMYVPRGVLRREGCSGSDWAGLKGQTVFMHFPARCTGFEAVLAAQERGVAAVIFLSPKTAVNTVQVTGHARFIAIPVHTVAPEDHDALIAFAEAYGKEETWVARGSYTLPAMIVDEGPPPTAIAQAAKPVLSEVQADVEAPEEGEHTVATTVVMLLIIVGLLVFLLHRLYEQYMLIIDPEVLCEFEDFGRLRGNPIEHGLTLERSNDKPSQLGMLVPLGVAATGMSFALLAAVTLATLLLAYHAGEDAAQAAMAHGIHAEEDSLEASQAGVLSAGQTLRVAMAWRVVLAVEDLLSNSQQAAATVAGFFSPVSKASWASFAAQLPLFRHYTALDASYVANVFTTSGFFASNEYSTDDRANFLRKDGVAYPVTLTNDGFPYGVNRYIYVPQAKRSAFWYNVPRHQSDVFNMLGSGVGRPLALLEDMADEDTRWVVPRRTWPGLFAAASDSPGGYTTDSYSVSAFVPVINSRFARIGVAEARLPLSELQRVVDAVVQGATQTENASVALFTLTDERTVLAANRWRWTASEGQFQKPWGAADLEALHTLKDIPVVELNALHGVLKEAAVGVHASNPILRTSFDQKAYYSSSPQSNVLSLSVDQLIGGVADYGSDGWEAEVHAAGGRSVEEVDSTTQRRVLVFSGEDVLRINQTLTTDTPAVARTRVDSTLPGETGWNSSVAYFQQGVRALPSGRLCPIHRVSTGSNESFEECVLRAHIFNRPYTVSLRVKPAVAAPRGAGDDAAAGVLFSDTLEGDANVRIYANGAMAMGLLSYGCYTPGVLLAVGQWHSITAVADYAHGACRVYVDGELAASGELAATYTAPPRGQAWAVGHRFKGSIDHVVVHSLAVSDRDARVLHARMSQPKATNIALSPQVDSKVWYVDAMRTSRGVGVDWACTVLVSRDDVLRWYEASRQRALEGLTTAGHNGMAKLRRSIHDVAFVATALVLACLVALLLFTDIFVSQFATLAYVMCEVAIMDLDDEQSLKTSYLRELNTLYRATRVMLRQLKGYRAYLQQALVVEAGEDLPDVVDQAQEISSQRSPAASHQSPSMSHQTPSSTGSRYRRSPGVGHRMSPIVGPGSPLMASKSPPASTALPPALKLKTPTTEQLPPSSFASPPLHGAMRTSPSLAGYAARRGAPLTVRIDADAMTGGATSPKAVTFSPVASRRRSSALFSPTNARMGMARSPVMSVASTSRQSRRMSHLFSPTNRGRTHSANFYPVRMGSIKRGSCDAASWGERGSLLGDSRFALRLRRVVNRAISLRQISWVAANICDYHTLTAQLSGDGMTAFHSSVVERMLTVFASGHAVPEMFHGDRFICSLNAYRDQVCLDHKAAACRIALTAKETMGNSHERINISVGVVSGMVKAGNLGTFFMKRHSFISPVISWGHALERYARLKGVPVLADHHVWVDVSHRFVHRLVGAVEYAKHESNRLVVAEVALERTGPGEAGSWMFAAAEGEEHPYRVWNDMLQAVLDGTWQEARGLAEELPSDVDVPLEEVAQARMAIQKEVYRPYQVLLH
eukprot:TRINITY_DN32558_c0_g1_i1.p1 TRINITY_DN32558_c0_g1~~TRINITY_DN32558_c0_g1_i1.p1  ORF type:complete len:1832 (+),score=395.89 TRINITY_DN32558_c0_g1_i1:76-5571(+)